MEQLCYRHLIKIADQSLGCDGSLSLAFIKHYGDVDQS